MLSQVLVILADKFDNFFKVFNVVKLISVYVLANLVNKILHYVTVIFLNNLLVKIVVYFKRFQKMTILINNKGRQYGRMDVMKKVLC